jgi:hypothetical protein
MREVEPVARQLRRRGLPLAAALIRREIGLRARTLGTLPSRRRVGVVLAALLAMGLQANSDNAVAQNTTLTVPNVIVTAPAPKAPPYLREPGRAYARNPYAGRYRVDESRFPVVPCTATRIASVAGGKCLLGYRLITAQTDQITNPKGGSNCDMALDVVTYNIGNLSIEADTLITDPYKTTAIGFHSSFCYVNGDSGYNQEDFEDMNQVTRRGTDWRNPTGDGEDKSMEFSDGPHQCVAVKKAGPHWEGGYIYMMHASVCRVDTAALQPADVTYALQYLQIRQYDPTGNLRRPGQ